MERWIADVLFQKDYSSKEESGFCQVSTQSNPVENKLIEFIWKVVDSMHENKRKERKKNFFA